MWPAMESPCTLIAAAVLFNSNSLPVRVALLRIASNLQATHMSKHVPVLNLFCALVKVLTDENEALKVESEVSSLSAL